jgi:hypothetical protein
MLKGDGLERVGDSINYCKKVGGCSERRDKSNSRREYDLSTAYVCMEISHTMKPLSPINICCKNSLPITIQK